MDPEADEITEAATTGDERARAAASSTPVALGVYEILGKLGAGGMGEVFKARDTRLDRIVALKILPRHLADRAKSRERFEREARAVAKLNHPHICTLYDIGQQDGADYLVMEYLEGDTVAQRLRRGPLPVEDALRYAIEMSDALDQAHRKGLVHRDIKPGNIMLTSAGWLKVLDFGLAKAIGDPREMEETGADAGPSASLAASVAGHIFLTQPGALLGTVAYMSPEQASGQPADARSDIYSFAAVVYEMLSGRRPHNRTAAAAVLEALLHPHVKPLRGYVPEVPLELERVVMQCLEKDPDRRIQQMKEVKSALDQIRAHLVDAADSTPSIAVLPFSNLSAEADNEYFSDGLTEDLIHSLAQVAGLRVVSRMSAFLFKDKREDVHEIGRKLGVRTVLDGSVRRAGNRLRITAQLIDVAGGCSLWSERFDRELADVFAVQDEVARTILTALTPKLASSPQAPAAKAYTDNFPAHELYLKGRFFASQQTPESLAKALDYFEQTIALAPLHAMAFVGLADCHLLRGWYGLCPANAAMPAARRAAEAALAIDDTLALAHSALALVESGYDWNWTAAGKRFARALELGPGFAAIHFNYALDYLTPLGRLGEAIQEIRAAQQFDPLSLITRTALGGCFYRDGQYDAAIQQFQNTLEIDPDFYHAHWSLGRALEQKYRFDDAIEAFQTADRLAGGKNPMILGEMAHCYALMSRPDDARAIAATLEAKSQESYVSPLAFAYIFTGLGEPDAAFRYLEAALEQRLRPLLWIGVDPRFARLRGDARFSSLLGRLGIQR